ncbi:tripartite tricarboxylate transporter TctB family protein [Mesorhizobium sp. CAU 1741]|uniref:tripartite tricarboxylate transporter TctB family protein n=1 Tax=Mesorhizobium sp. CAU 1741 TaxID=3140366 RepID=UPI00325AEECC
MDLRNTLRASERFVPIGIFGAFTLWYVGDSWAASSRPENLILILPAALVVLGCLGIELVKELEYQPDQLLENGRWEPVSPRTLGLMGLLVLYVGMIPLAGIDVASFFFAAMSCWLMGERRLWVTAVFALGISAICVFAFSRLISTPLPLTTVF